MKLLDTLPSPLKERCRSLGSEVVQPTGSFVLYWMRTAVRTDENPALITAVHLANQLGLPVLIYHALSERYSYANDRHHTFILEGARDVQNRIENEYEGRVGYVFHLERPTDRRPHLRTLASKAAVVLTEDLPVDPLQRWTQLLARNSAAPVVAVDTACVVPMQLVGKAHTRAFAFRKATKKLYAQRLTACLDTVSPEVNAGNLSTKDLGGLDLASIGLDLQQANLVDLVSECEIDHSIGPVLDTVGGSTAGYARWESFKKRGLASYAKKRNNALLDGVSRMSAYFHYGMVSPQRIARECAELDHAGAEKYLDELLIWRELAYGFCFYRSDHGRISALPDWAIETLRDHEGDRRRVLSREALSRAKTGDDLWDAAQRSLLVHGELHNNVRMTWGKAILEWTQDARAALATLIDLNHRYALDGRDPASYGGILWCLGQFDRPFPPARPVLGTVRDRSTEQHSERLDVAAFAARTGRPLREPMPHVGIVGAGLSGLACARTLQDHGFRVSVIEKSRGCGGRMATRRVDHGSGDQGELRFDHGAQYFTARDERFRRYVQSWQQDGIVAPWNGHIVVVSKGQVQAEKSGTRRYVAVPGMNAIGRHLGADLDIRLQAHVGRIARSGDRWQLNGRDGADLGNYDAVVVTAPAAQTATLLEAYPHIAERARATQMSPCWAMLMAFTEPLHLPFDGAFVGDAGSSKTSSRIAWLAKNSSKPGRAVTPETWVVHASPEWSAEHVELTKEEALEKLTEAFWQETGCVPRDPEYATTHRWMYSIPPTPLKEPCLFDAQQRIGACGDWCGGPRVEGAFLSGMAMAGRLMGQLKQDAGEMSCK